MPQFVEAARELAGAGDAERAAAFDARARFHHDAAAGAAAGGRANGRSRRRHSTTSGATTTAHPRDAQKLLKAGERKPDPALPPAEFAALTMVANQMLNLDEVLNK